jgi:hypothetical protein
MAKQEQIELFQKLESKIVALNKEISILSKTKPDNPINKFKIQIINEILSEANNFLADQQKPFGDFEKFDQIEFPTNSDVVLVLTHYINSLNIWRSKNTISDDLGLGLEWIIDREPSPRAKQSSKR